MRAAALFLVLILAHALSIGGQHVPISIWNLPAYFWQDALLVLVFAGVDALLARPRLMWATYAAIVTYSAINVPISFVLSSPLTLPMIRAAAGPLRDSVVHHLTWVNTAACLAVVVAGIAVPYVLDRRDLLSRRLLVSAALLALAGPVWSRRVDTLGLDRNAAGALWESRPLPQAPSVDWRQWRRSPFGGEAYPDLQHYSGRAAGRNVVMIALESTAAQYLRVYRAPEDPTPNLTRLSDHAILFQNAYATYPESIRGLWSVICSQYPQFNSPADIDANAPCRSMAQVLKSEGYRTALFHSGRFGYLGMDRVVMNRGFELLEDAGSIGGNVQSSFGVDDASTIRRLLAWIDSIPRGERFFAFYLPVSGHHPYESPPPRPFPEATESDRYRNALYSGDAVLGDLVQGLRNRGLGDKTLLVIFGDHGEAFGQHELNWGHTGFLHEENVHVPYLIAADGLIQEPVRVSKVVSLMDTAPTILDLLGIPIPAAYRGTSMLDPSPLMAPFFTGYGLPFLGLRDGCWKAIEDMRSERLKLFDLCVDPGEFSDLAALESNRAAVYRRVLEQSVASQK